MASSASASASAETPPPTPPVVKLVPPAKHKVRHRKVKQGETIYKGHPSWNMMLNIKLGVSYSVGRIASEGNRELKQADFKTVFKQEFPPEGSPLTPGHSAENFKFKDHAPFAFRHLREHFGVDTQEYMVSICGEHSLRELGTPGKSGAVFYLTEDGQFLIKTVSKKESKFLRQILPNYYHYVMRCEDTLIPRFFGLIRIKTRLGRNIRMVVMNNLLPRMHKIHEKYDLKGSTLGRWATEEEKRSPHVTLKDLDLKHELALPPRALERFQKQVHDDCGWLRSLGIMDYSLLMLLHFRDHDEGEGDEERSEDISGGVDSYREGARSARAASGGSQSRHLNGIDESDAAGGPICADGPGTTPALLEAAAAGAASAATVPSTMDSGASTSRGARFRLPGVLRGGGRGSEDDDSDDDDEAKGSNANLPRLNDADLAQAFARSRASSMKAKESLFSAEGALPALLWEPECRGQEVLIFGGIIDVLQQYGARKQLEHTYKSVRYQKEKDGISVTDPSHYAARFAKFILGKFVDSSKGGAEPAAALPAADGAAPAAAPTPPPLESPRAEGRASPAL